MICAKYPLSFWFQLCWVAGPWNLSLPVIPGVLHSWNIAHQILMMSKELISELALIYLSISIFLILSLLVILTLQTMKDTIPHFQCFHANLILEYVGILSRENCMYSIGAYISTHKNTLTTQEEQNWSRLNRNSCKSLPVNFLMHKDLSQFMQRRKVNFILNTCGV